MAINNKHHLELLNYLNARIESNSSYPNYYLIEKDRFFYWVMNPIYLAINFREDSLNKTSDCFVRITQIPTPSDILLTEDLYSLYKTLIDKNDFYKIMHEVADEINSLPHFHVECITPNEENGVRLAKMTISISSNCSV